MFERVGLFITVLFLSIASSSICADPVSARDKTADEPAPEQATFVVRGNVVIDSDGKPVADADVRLVSWTKNNTRYDTKKTRSDKDGIFKFEGVGKGQHRLVAFFDDFASRKSLYKGESVDLGSTEPVTLKLTKMPHISVKVVSKADGKPIVGARVQLVWSDTERDHRADKNGEVVLRALTPEVWHVKARANGFASRQEAVNLAQTEAADVKFELKPGGKLFGMIRDEAGNGIAGAGISVRPAESSGLDSEYVTTDDQGGYHVDNLELNQNLELSINKSGFLDKQENAVLGIDSTAKKEVNIVLKRRPHGGTLRGTVSDENGKPIVGATIANQGRRSSDQRNAKTVDGGQFVLDDVFEGGSLTGYEIVVKAKGFSPQRVKFQPGTKDKPGEVAIKMGPGHRIRGRVLNDDAKPIAGVRVYHSRGNYGGGVNLGDGTTTDKEGVFEFDSLPANAPFSLYAKGYSDIEEAKLPLDGALEAVVTMREQGVLRGKVVDAETKKPITTFNVRITFSPDRKPNDPGHHLSGARSTTPDGERFANKDGSFLLDDLIDGMPLQVTVSAENYERQIIRRVLATAKSAAEETEFALAPINESKLIAIHGRIVDDKGKPIAGAELRFIAAENLRAQRRRGGRLGWNEYPFNWQMIQSGQVDSVDGVSQVLSAVSDKEGAFVFERIRPASFLEIAYWGEGVSKGRREELEKLTPEERKELILTSASPGVVRGSIDRKALPEISHVELTAADNSMAFDHEGAELKDKQTKYEIRDVPPGRYALLVYGEYTRTENDSFSSKVVQRRDVEVKAGETVTLDLGENQ